MNSGQQLGQSRIPCVRVTQSAQVTKGFTIAALWLGWGASLASGQASAAPDTVKVYTEHPRLFLRPNRLRLLQRDRDRKSLRWEQFELLITGNAPMPEPGFAFALYYRITGNQDYGHKAVTWAMGAKTDARQLALVYDWCQDVMSEQENKALVSRLESAANAPGDSLDSMRDRVLAAISLADHSPAVSETTLNRFFQHDWALRVQAIHANRNPIPRNELFSLYEILHAVRDNLNFEMREQLPAYFKELPIAHLLSHYPAPYPAAENEYRIPATLGTGEPDLRSAALSRVAELCMVALDTNAPESQVLQGWLMNDRFLLRGPFGNPYELLWANPYQPGLSYYHVPLVFHDNHFGQVFVRSSWEDSASWAGYFEGQLQLFQDGKVSVLDPAVRREPLDLEEAIVFFGRDAHQFQLPNKDVNDAFIVGLQPNQTYRVEIDDEELRESLSGPGGILFLPGVYRSLGIRFTPAPAPSPQ